jgi:membrane-bound lytic murein transglycosylase F
MFDKQRKLLLFVVFCTVLLAGVFVFSLIQEVHELPLEEEAPTSDLADILERGVLRATTNYNSTNYFIYRGEPMGFHLELLRQFASSIGVGLEIFVSNDLDENFDCLLYDKGCDLIALDLAVTKSRRQKLQFTEPHSKTRQVLVQRKSNEITEGELNNGRYFIASQYELAGKTVFVHKNSAYVSRLQNLMEEIGDTIYIVEMLEDNEQLIEMVSRGEIDYTVSDEHIARLNSSYYSNIDVQIPLSFEQHLAWAVRPGSDNLLDAINEWLVEFKQTQQYTSLYNKYYRNPRGVFLAKSIMHSQGGGRVSAYDHYFKRYAEMIGWDWRLLASLAYQESRFDPEAVSWAGAFGVMQLMPGTAEAYNVDPESPVAENIRAGANYLRWLDRLLSEQIIDEQERLKFVLAAYNVGIGHVLDARRLAEKYGKDPNVWKDNVDYYVLNKSKPEYYKDPVVKFGYARGAEPFNYVNEILERFSHYLNALAG